MFVCVAVPKYFLLSGCGKRELIIVGGDGDVALGLLVTSYRTIHMPILMHLLLLSGSHPLYLTSTPMPDFVNCALHPALHSFMTEIRKKLAKIGMV